MKNYLGMLQMNTPYNVLQVVFGVLFVFFNISQLCQTLYCCKKKTTHVPLLFQKSLNVQGLKTCTLTCTFDVSLIVYNLSFFFADPISNGVTIDVWIQGEKITGGLIFHDGSPFPTKFDTFCPLGLGSDPNETRVRAHGSSAFE